MAETMLEDSTDSWKYVILLSKFVLLFVDGGIAKSFGVLIPGVVVRYDSDFGTVALVLSLPSTMMYFTVPIATLLMKVMTPRTMGMIGGLLSAVPIICAPLAQSIYILGMMLAVTGFGMALTFFPIMVSINDYFAKSFIFSNTLTLFGTTCGAFLVPVIIERSLEAYGYNGGFLILGGIALHAVVCGAVIRPPRDRNIDNVRPSAEGEGDSLIVVQPAESTEIDVLAVGETSTALTELNEQDSKSKNDTMARSSSSTSWRCSCDSFTSTLTSFIFFQEPYYTLIAPAIILQCFVMAAWMLFLVPHAEEAGIERSNAVFLFTIAGISGIFGRILYLVLLHFKCDNTIIFCFTCTISAISCFIDSVSSSYIFLAAMALIQGTTFFILDCLPHAMMKLSVRNEANIPRAISPNLLLVGIGVITGDALSGYIYDVTSSFGTVFVVYGALLVLITVNLVIFKLNFRRWSRE
ncbi:monocarboxylate transporter 3-like [Strongylocentrotus purpuratus]|uniref:Monocarboxylate transporter n=1 Tax=Strongylocentrotus purpuratus TaxID=7668 RepID=A0A7M7N495_STRPU|nr:monocarboxylate transporter 3-like [Strongylocentrotus purpuratus]